MTHEGKTILDAIVAGLDGVTPGPWRHNRVHDNAGVVHGDEIFRDGNRELVVDDVVKDLDAAHIARCDPDSISAIAAYVAELQSENDRLRAALANSDQPCAYCSLPRDEWAKCSDGFPGCGRADDAMGCPELGAVILAADLERQVAALRDALSSSQDYLEHLHEALGSQIAIEARGQWEWNDNALSNAAEAAASFEARIRKEAVERAVAGYEDALSHAEAEKRIRADEREKLAAYCERTTMETVTQPQNAQFCGCYVAGEAISGPKHPGMGYAAAIRAMGDAHD